MPLFASPGLYDPLFNGITGYQWVLTQILTAAQHTDCLVKPVRKTFDPLIVKEWPPNLSPHPSQRADPKAAAERAESAQSRRVLPRSISEGFAMNVSALRTIVYKGEQQ
jgi:hypothetical protein